MLGVQIIFVFLLYSLNFHSQSWFNGESQHTSLSPVEIFCLFSLYKCNITILYLQPSGRNSVSFDMVSGGCWDWVKAMGRKEKVHSLLEEFLKAPEGLYNNLARPQIVLFTTSVIAGGHKQCPPFFFKRKREVCSACWLIHITKSLENLLEQIKPIKVPWVGRKGNVCLSPVNLLIFKSIFGDLSSVWIVDTENLLVEKIYRILSDGWGEAVTDPDSHRRMSFVLSTWLPSRSLLGSRTAGWSMGMSRSVMVQGNNHRTD